MYDLPVDDEDEGPPATPPVGCSRDHAGRDEEGLLPRVRRLRLQDAQDLAPPHPPDVVRRPGGASRGGRVAEEEEDVQLFVLLVRLRREQRPEEAREGQAQGREALRLRRLSVQGRHAECSFASRSLTRKSKAFVFLAH